VKELARWTTRPHRRPSVTVVISNQHFTLLESIHTGWKFKK
jgi:hypothetical protein